LDEHPYTVDLLRDTSLDAPLFVIGGDEWRDFPTWKEPDEVLRRARVAVGTRAGVPESPADGRVAFFDLDSPLVSAREVRSRIADGEHVDGLVPPAVEELIRELGLYRDYTSSAPKKDVEAS
jgi:nicotinate-nucleotide adenylyltransferase